MNENAVAIAKMLYDTGTEMYLNSADAVEKSLLSECLDELKVILNLMPAKVPADSMKMLLEFLSKIYVPNDLMNFYIGKKRAESTEVTYTLCEIANRANPLLRTFDVIVEGEGNDFTVGVILSISGKS